MKPYNHKEKIELHDSMMDMLIKMSEGNPGGLSVLMQFVEKSRRIDPDDLFAPIGPILSLDTHGIYGSNIWILYKNCCGQSIENTLAALRSVQMGLMSESDLWKAIDNCTPFNTEEMMTNLQKELPHFNAPTPAAV